MHEELRKSCFTLKIRREISSEALSALLKSISSSSHPANTFQMEGLLKCGSFLCGATDARSESKTLKLIG